jgi:hypothetical protein
MPFAESSIQRCAEVLDGYSGKPRSVQEIVKSIRKLWASAYRESFGSTVTYNQILLAIYSELDHGATLFHSANQVLARSTTGFEAIGCGEVVFKYVIGADPYCGPSAREQGVFECAIRACAHAKVAMPTVIGGNLIAANLGNDGGVTVYSQQEIEWIERYSLAFDQLARYAAAGFVDVANDGRFERLFKALNRDSLGLRAEWKQRIAGLGGGKFGMPPAEAMELARVFASSTRSAKPIPQWTKHD